MQIVSFCLSCKFRWPFYRHFVFFFTTVLWCRSKVHNHCAAKVKLAKPWQANPVTKEIILLNFLFALLPTLLRDSFLSGQYTSLWRQRMAETNTTTRSRHDEKPGASKSYMSFPLQFFVYVYLASLYPASVMFLLCAFEWAVSFAFTCIVGFCLTESDLILQLIIRYFYVYKCSLSIVWLY